MESCTGCQLLKTEAWAGKQTAYVCTSKDYFETNRTILVLKNETPELTKPYRPAWCKRR